MLFVLGLQWSIVEHILAEDAKQFCRIPDAFTSAKEPATFNIGIDQKAAATNKEYKRWIGATGFFNFNENN